jgi:hypothetical protein
VGWWVLCPVSTAAISKPCLGARALARCVVTGAENRDLFGDDVVCGRRDAGRTQQTAFEL